jgi:hypothetical protein
MQPDRIIASAILGMLAVAVVYWWNKYIQGDKDKNERSKDEDIPTDIQE